MSTRLHRVALGAILGLTVVLAGASPAVAQSSPEPDTARTIDSRTIDVVGTGVVRGTPDILDLTLGIDVRAKSAADALGRNSDLVRKVLALLRSAGVTNDDIQTADLSIWPMTNDDGTAVIGYSVSNSLAVTIRDLDAAGKIVDTATEVASDEIVVRGLSFSFDDNSLLVARARTEAVRRAKAQAEQLAKAADVSLGRLLRIRESSAPQGPIAFASETTADSKAAAPIRPGAQSLTVEVSLRYQIA